MSIHPTAIVDSTVKIKGNVTIGSGSVIQAMCVLDASLGHIEIGADCVFESGVQVVNTRWYLLFPGIHDLTPVSATSCVSVIAMYFRHSALVMRRISEALMYSFRGVR